MRPAGAALAAFALTVRAAPAPAQQVTLGPQLVLVSYREVASGLRYEGTGFGGAVVGRFRRLSAEAAVARVTLDPADGSAGLRGFTATQVDAWLAYDVAPYASVEVGIAHRSVDPELDAQSVGAVRVGARAASEIGPGAAVTFRVDYLAAPRFSGGGRAPFSLDLGLGLDVRLAGRLHGTAAYAFQRIGRKTDPGGTGETDSPIQQSVARVGLALGF